MVVRETMLNEQIANCKKCKLCKVLPLDLTPVVPLIGTTPKVMLITDNPRLEELMICEPISTLEQEFLKKYIDINKLYITNLVKCNPIKIQHGKKNDRSPLKSEINMCKDWLLSEIENLKPSTIIGCGTRVNEFFLKTKDINYYSKVDIDGMTFIPSYSIKHILNRATKDVNKFVQMLRMAVSC